jgi:hypothetical protein
MLLSQPPIIWTDFTKVFRTFEVFPFSEHLKNRISAA